MADITSSGCAFPAHGCSPISPGAPAPWPQPHALGQQSLVLISWNCRLGTTSTMPLHWSAWRMRVRIMKRRGLAMPSKTLGSKRSLVPNAPYDGKHASALVGLARSSAAGTDIVRFVARCAGGRGRWPRTGWRYQRSWPPRAPRSGSRQHRSCSSRSLSLGARFFWPSLVYVPAILLLLVDLCPRLMIKLRRGTEMGESACPPQRP